MERRCFACDGERAVMPAFGAYAGGLSIRDAAFAKIFRTPGFMAHVLGDQAARDRRVALLLIRFVTISPIGERVSLHCRAALARKVPPGTERFPDRCRGGWIRYGTSKQTRRTITRQGRQPTRRRSPSRMGRFSPRLLLKSLGPGLITGASDDDPSGIGTYSQAGAQLGYGIGWTMLLTFPLMAAIQEISARVGRVTGHGIAGNVCRHYSSWLLNVVVALLFIANTINIAADLGAMARRDQAADRRPRHSSMCCCSG